MKGQGKPTLAPDPTDAIQTAKYLAGIGWRLVPMTYRSKKYANCLFLPGGKWRHLRYKQTTPEDIEKWINEDPKTGMAVITGNGMAVLDVDRLHKFPSDLELPNSVRINTPRGFRVFYKCSPDLAQGKIPCGCGEFLNGNLAVLPPSIHPWGIAYEWAEGFAPWEIEIAEITEPIIRLVTKPVKHSRRGSTAIVDGKNSEVGNKSPVRLAYENRDTVNRLLPTLKIPEHKLGTAFRCVLPNCKDNNPSASLYESDNGVWVYHNWHGCNGSPEFLTLAEVYASQISGRVETLKYHAPTHAVWGSRLLIESGVWEPAPNVPFLIRGYTPNHNVMKVADGLRLLFQIRWRTNYGEPVPFTVEFASRWCGMGRRQAFLGLRWLIENGGVESIPIGDRKRLFLPSKKIENAA